jgi:transposase InsO family protein
VIEQLAGEYPVAALCQWWDLPRSSFYYRTRRTDSPELLAALLQLAAQWPTYGWPRLTAELRRQGWAVNHKRVQRLMGALGLQARQKRHVPHTTHSGHRFRRFPNLVQDLSIVYPDQVWVADITYIRLRLEFVYLAVVMDVFTRCIRGWHLWRGLDLHLTVTALERGLQGHRPEIHHSDQGFQYAAPEYVQRLEAAQVQISMAEVGAAWQNGYAERLIRTIKEEEVALADYRNYREAYEQLGHFIDEVYMQKRIHSALGYLTPVEFERQWLAQRQLQDRVSYF